MAEIILVGIDDEWREVTEYFIGDVYLSRYGAKIGAFPPLLIASIDDNGRVRCAAGLRTQHDPFFSEHYLDAPVDEILSALSGRTVKRDEIFEVSALASRDPHATAGFIEEIIAFGETSGFAWSFFTLTRRLGLMLERLGLAPAYLADADHRRIADFERWGTYYAGEPKVYAVANARLARCHSFAHRMLCDANAV
jgi:hypothetical protein